MEHHHLLAVSRPDDERRVETPGELQLRHNFIPGLKTSQCLDTNRLQVTAKENIDKVPSEAFTPHQMSQGEFPQPQSELRLHHHCVVSEGR